MRRTTLKPMITVVLVAILVLMLVPGIATSVESDTSEAQFKGTTYCGGWRSSDMVPNPQYGELDPFELFVADGGFSESGVKGKGVAGQLVTFRGYYPVDTCEWWRLDGTVRHNEAFPFDPDTGLLTIESQAVVAAHESYPVDTSGGPEPCVWSSYTAEYYAGDISVEAVLTPAEKCNKKKPEGCASTNSLDGTFTVDLPDTPFHGAWQNGDFDETWWSSTRFNGTLVWSEPSYFCSVIPCG